MVSAFAQCPNCGSAETRRLEIVYEDGLQDVSTRSSGVGLGGGAFGLGGGVGTASTKGIQQSRLSRSAAPPAKKEVGSIVLLLILAVLGALVIPNTTARIIGIVVGAICVFAIVDASKFNSTAFPRLYADWSDTFLCLRCGNRFLATQERDVTTLAPELPGGTAPALPESPESTATDRFCTNCGKKSVASDQKFCGACGSLLPDPSRQSSLATFRTSVQLRVTDKGPKTINAIATLRNLVPSLGLAEAKDIVEGKRDLTLSPGEATLIKSRLEADGATVSVQ